MSSHIHTYTGQDVSYGNNIHMKTNRLKGDISETTEVEEKKVQTRKADEI